MPNNGHNKVDDLRDDVVKDLREFGREARHKANDAKKNVVSTLYEAAETIRREAREAKAGKEVTDSADRVAHSLERAAHYVKRHSFEDMGEDIGRVVRRSRFTTALIVLLVGVIIGVSLRGDGRRS